MHSMYRGNGFVWGVAAITLALLAFGAARTKSAQKNMGPSSSEWRVAEPVRYENLSVFPILSRQSANTAGFATLDEGLSSGEVVVTEGGGDALMRSRDGRPVAVPQQRGASVNQLVLINRGSKPLLLLAGELVSGGKQDRIISKDRIVPPGAAPLPLDVFCVENGRWTGGVQFTAGKMMVHPSVREQAAITKEQDKVWAAVRNGTTAAPSAAPPAALGEMPRSTSQTVTVTESVPMVSAGGLAQAIEVTAPTQSYQKLYKSPQVAVPADTFTDEMQRRFHSATSKLKGEAVVGVIVAYNGEVAWSDIFASPSLFERYWPKLLRSYVVEALVRPRTSEQASLDDAREFLKPLTGHESTETEPAIYSLKQITSGKYVDIELDALQPVNLTLHVLKVHKTS